MRARARTLATLAAALLTLHACATVTPQAPGVSDIGPPSSAAAPLPDVERGAGFCARHVGLCGWLVGVAAVAVIVLLTPHKDGPAECVNCAPSDPTPVPLPVCMFPPGPLDVPGITCRSLIE